MTQQTQWLIGGKGSMVAEKAQLPGAQELGTRAPHAQDRHWVCRCAGVRLVGAERLTRSFPLAMDRESGEWPLHSMFGFALCERRSRTMSLAHCGKKSRSTRNQRIPYTPATTLSPPLKSSQSLNCWLLAPAPPKQKLRTGTWDRGDGGCSDRPQAFIYRKQTGKALG